MTNKEAIESLKNMIDTQSIGAVLPNGEKALWQYHIEALNMAISALQPHWIPVTERLPEHKQYVLVTDSDGDVEIASLELMWEGDDHEDYVWWLPEYGRIEVTAWMPLPEPWKGGHS